jgi:16S rRNA (uracil1498-N3)-methyltransferase
VQVLRLQPGMAVTLFDGEGREAPATILRMGRSEVSVEAAAAREVDRELWRRVTLAMGMPANDRMDALVEKATELGVAVIQPLVCERSVLRLSGERAQKRREHWQAIAVAACEQSGRARVPVVEPVLELPAWLRELPPAAAGRCVLSLSPQARPLHAAAPGGEALFLSGPEGGLAPAEEQAAVDAGFAPVTLGPRVLRADTAPLAALAWIALAEG